VNLGGNFEINNMHETKEQKIEELLTRGVAEVIDRSHLTQALLGDKPLRVKFGIDPTSPNIHLGRSVPLLKLRDFQELGHAITIQFIVGDFTGQVGDTSDKDAERPMLSPDLVKQNMKTYLKQVYKILHKDKTQIKVSYNSKWLSKLTLDKVGALATWFSLSEFIARENIKKRLDEGKRISLRELFYPLMQGYDSVMVDADLEIGGTDQRFNLLAGREIQRHHLPTENERKIIEKNIGGSPYQRWGKELATREDPLHREPQDILMTNLIMGTDGRKMSSSWGNTINILDTPHEMFQNILKIPNEVLLSYFIHCTRIPLDEVQKIDMDIKNGSLHPMDAQRLLAKELVTFYHSKKKAEKEYKISKTISEGKVPENIPKYEPALEGYENLETFIARVGLASSKSDARRKIEQGGVTIGDEKESVGTRMLKKELDDGKVMKVGKKDFVKIVFSPKR
jgi:tyrosyl-tRNA synthetase